MAAARRARRSKRIRFRSKRGAGHGAAFRTHKGGLARQQAFSAHAARVIKVRKAAAARPWKAPKAPAYKGIGARNPYPAKARAAAFKSAARKAPAAWVKAKRKPAKYRKA